MFRNRTVVKRCRTESKESENIRLYLYHYGLNEKAFQVTANPEYLWFGEKQLQTCGTLTHGIIKKKGITLLTGEVGTGKTVLLHHLAETIDPSASARAKEVSLLNPVGIE